MGKTGSKSKPLRSCGYGSPKNESYHWSASATQLWKWNLVRKLFEQGYSRNDVVELFRLIDWMMTLPDRLEREFRTELRQYQEERQMPYVTSIERLAKEEGQREIIENILKVRFGALDEQLASIVDSLLALPPEEYTRLLLELSREDLLTRFSQTKS